MTLSLDRENFDRGAFGTFARGYSFVMYAHWLQLYSLDELEEGQLELAGGTAYLEGYEEALEKCRDIEKAMAMG